MYTAKFETFSFDQIMISLKTSCAHLSNQFNEKQ